MWKKINSPIVVVLVALLGLAAIAKSTKPKLATEIRAAYQELNAIIQDGAADAEKTKAIQAFAQEIGTQLKQGFAEGMRAGESGKSDADKEYIEARKTLAISDIKKVESQWPGREKILYTLRNDSDKYLKQIKLNFEYYRGEDLIDCDNKWISDVSILEPGQKIALSQERHFPQDSDEEKKEQMKSDRVVIVPTSFLVKDIE